MSQEAVAKAAGIGRSTLVHLENGADVRLSKISAVAKALDTQIAEVTASAEPQDLAERRQARQQLALRMLTLQNTHLRIALDLMQDEPTMASALGDARDMVELWAREKVCSAFYIDSWRRLLSGAARDVGAALARIDKQWESALLQNSPFTAQLTPVNNPA